MKFLMVVDDLIVIQIENENFCLSAKAIHEGIKELQRGLFVWHEVTGKRIDEDHPT